MSHSITTAGAAASCKTAFVLALLENLVQAAIAERKWRFLRIDGSVVSAFDRAVRSFLTLRHQSNVDRAPNSWHVLHPLRAVSGVRLTALWDALTSLLGRLSSS